MKNQTADIDEVGKWMDKWATVKLNNSDFTGGSVKAPYDPIGNPDGLRFNSNDPTNSSLGEILYYYDPTAARGMPFSDNGFQVPVTSGVDVVYQG